jgi:hypothetical protein
MFGLLDQWPGCRIGYGSACQTDLLKVTSDTIDWYCFDSALICRVFADEI